MKQIMKLSINNYTKVLIPASRYNIELDERLLIPYTNGGKIGFINKKGEIIVKPHFNMYYGDCYKDNDLIKVSVDYLYGYSRNSGNVSCYKRPVYGVLNSKGELILPLEFYSIGISDCKQVFTVENKEYRYGVITLNGEEVIPYGKYNWIDSFKNGVARVKIGKISNGLKDSDSKWGIIDVNGKELLSVEYDDLWIRGGIINLEKNGIKKRLLIKDLLHVNPTLDANTLTIDDFELDKHYDEYTGSYAQDVMGFSDECINDAFEGDPEAYWNID